MAFCAGKHWVSAEQKAVFVYSLSGQASGVAHYPSLQQKHWIKLTLEHEESFRNNHNSIYYVMNVAKNAYYSDSGFLFNYRVSFYH